jgi:hypothetical protein
VIVYGWGNYWKRNSEFHRDVCQHCGGEVHLHSFDTTKFFSIYWVPLLPLGSKRIIDLCSHCEMGREMSLGQWKKLRRTELAPAIEAVRMDPGNVESAEKALGLVTQLGTKEDFAQLVGLLAGKHNQDGQLMAKLAWGFHYFLMPDQADQAVNASLAVEDNEDVRKLQSHLSQFPKSSSPTPPSKLREAMPLLILPAILLVFAIIFGFKGATGEPERVFVVNGLTVPYKVSINGTEHSLKPRSHRHIRVPYGTIDVGPVPGSLPIEPYTFELGAGFFDRAGSGPTVAINPDKTAAIVWEEAAYTTGDPAEGLEGDIKMYVGEGVYTFDELDYSFTDFPEELELSRDIDWRYGVYMLEDYTPTEVLGEIVEWVDMPHGRDFLRNTLKLHPEEKDLVVLMASIEEDPGEVIAFLETGLERRPLLVNWHRYYQELVESAEPERDLVSEYRQLYEEEPDNRNAAYLLGRIVDDREDALELYRAATREPNPSAYAFYAMAYDHMGQGEFPEGLEQVRRAVELEPDNSTFTSIEEEMLLANRKYFILRQRRESELAEYPLDFDTARSVIQLLALEGNLEKAEEEAAAFVAKGQSQKQLEEEDRPVVEAAFKAAIAEATGNVADFVTHARAVSGDDPTAGFALEAAVVGGELSKAAELMVEQAETVSYRDHLLLYALAKAKGEEELARGQLDALAVMLEDSTEDSKTVLSWFSEGAQPPEVQEVIDTLLMPNELRVSFAALGMRHPEHAAKYIGQAEKMNYDPGYPAMALRGLIADVSAGADAVDPVAVP